MADACTGALRPRVCVVSDASPNATVLWGASEAVIEVRTEMGDLRSRRIAFREEDADRDRFRAAGLVVASLALDAFGARAEENPMARTPSEKPSPSAWLGIATEIGNGLRFGAPRYGGRASGGYALPGFPAFVAAELGYTVAFRNAAGVAPTWFSIGIGLGPILDVRALDLALRPRVDLLFTDVGATVQAPPDRSAVGNRWLGGGGISLELAWPVRTPISLLADVGGSFLSGATGVRISGAEVAAFPAISYEFVLGIQGVLAR